jgi:hypothetical protein
MTLKKGIKIKDFLDCDVALPEAFKRLLFEGSKITSCGTITERDLILRLLAITSYQSIKIDELEREVARVKDHLMDNMTRTPSSREV